MQENRDFGKYRKITERFCYEIGENVVLRSTTPEGEVFECLHSPFCEKRGSCERCKNAADKAK